MNRISGALALLLLSAGVSCVDVPVPGAPVDAAPVDRGSDTEPEPEPEPDSAIEPPPDAALDRGPEPEPEPDAEPDAAPEPEPDAAPEPEPDAGLPPVGCLAPLDGEPDDDDPCLEVYAAAPLPTARIHAAGGTVTGFADGARVVVTGGYDRLGVASEADQRSWIYDPVDDTWSAGPMPNAPRWGAAAVVDDAGALVLAGGAPSISPGGQWTGLAAAERFDGQRWTAVPDQLEPGRAQAAALPLSDGLVLVVGGRVSHDAAPTVNGDRVDGDRIESIGAVLANPRAEAAAARLPDGRLLVVGGRGAAGTVESRVEVGTVDGRVFVPTPGPLLGGVGSAVAPLSDGALIVGGATDAAPAGSTEAWRFTSAYDRAASLPPMAAGRIHPTITAIGPSDGDWRLVVGGDEQGIVELYDPRTERLIAYPLPAPWDHGRRLHVAAAVPTDDGLEVLIVGGSRLPLTDGLPITDVLRFRLTPPPPVDRAPPLPEGCLEAPDIDAPCLRVRRGPRLPWRASRLAGGSNPDGRVFVSGGLDPDAPAGERVRADSAALELGGSIWRTGPPMELARWGHVVTVSWLWNNPTVYAYGGTTFDPAVSDPYRATDDFERWDLALDDWISTGVLGRPRIDAAVLPFERSAAAWMVGGRSTSDGAALADGDQLTRGIITPLPPLDVARIDAALCASESLRVVVGGHGPDGVEASIEASDNGAGWRLLDPGLDPRTGAGCLGQPDFVDLFGGSEVAGGAPTNSWQRLLRQGDGFEARRFPGMGRRRLRPSVSRIGVGEDAEAAWLIVGGEDPRDDSPPAVELVMPTRNGVGRIFTYPLPAGVSLRRDHAAITREVSPRPDRLIDREVLIVGGLRPDGAALDETLIFSIDGGDAVAEPPPDGMQ